MMNPLGFVTENFDSLGRTRERAKIFASDGNLTGEVDVDTTVVPQVILEDEESTASNAVELTRLLVDSKKVEACFSVQ